jgi:hypothetical protein
MMSRRALLAAVSLIATAIVRAPRADAQGMGMPGMSDSTTRMVGVLSIPMSRDASGTSWLPDASPMMANHFSAGSWDFMFHYRAFVYYDRQNDAERSQRGDDQIGSVNWAMLMAAHQLGTGRLQLRGMMSAEPWTVGAAGYPLLLQSGESYHGQPLHDRQHPHDLFMELAAIYTHSLGKNLALQAYVAPVGEPASGPVAFPHRPSAAGDPFAPLGHHWQDATHISYGVITAGIFSRSWKLETSIFNGREPDQDRTNFDYKGRSLDSYSARFTVNPSAPWSVSTSYGYFKSPEALDPAVSEQRITASVLNTRPVWKNGEWASAIIYGGNKLEHTDSWSSSLLAESNLTFDRWNSVFTRVEYVEKSADDLDILDRPADSRFKIGSAAIGYVRELIRYPGGSLGLGARFAVDFVPAAIAPDYGSRTPTGLAVYLRFRPRRLRQSAMTGMSTDTGRSVQSR